MRTLALLLMVAAVAAVEDTGTNATAGVRLARYAGDKAAAVSFTFDDGHKSHAEIAGVLDSYGIKATFFVVTKWVPDAPAEGAKAKLSWPELRALAEAGHEIGNHSCSISRSGERRNRGDGVARNRQGDGQVGQALTGQRLKMSHGLEGQNTVECRESKGEGEGPHEHGTHG